MSGMRRQFELPENDRHFLEELGRPWETVRDGATQWVLMHEWSLCEGYNHCTVSLGVMIQPGYPDVQLDMIYVSPALQRTDGKAIGALTSHVICGQPWQRWSRHRTATNPWRAGVDDLASHMALAAHWFNREFQERN